MKRALLPIVLLLAACLPGLSQERLTDLIRPGNDLGSQPYGFTEFNDQLFFVAATAREGRELWKTDGTPAGTTLVKDIYPGAASAMEGNVAATGTALYFLANDGVRGVQLWKSDGTPGGTQSVTNFLRGNVLGLTPVNGQLFFLVESAEYTWEVWKSDGTAAGTVPVKRNIPGWNTPESFIAAGNLFYFTLQAEGANDSNVWRSDGTDAGTFAVIGGIDGNGAGEGGSASLTQFIAYKDELYFVARSAETFGYDQSVGIFKTNGTRAGTIPVKGLHPGGTRLIAAADVVALGGKLYFSFYERDLNRLFIWESDGTPTGTRMAYDVSSTAYFMPSNLAHTDTELVFNAPGTNNTTALVKWNPVNGTTTTLKETPAAIAKPAHYDGDWQPTFIRKGRNNSLLVYATVALEPSNMNPLRKFWLSDGTPQGTVQLEDLQPGFSTEAAYFKDDFYAPGLGKGVGVELHRVNAAARLVTLLKNINPAKNTNVAANRLYPLGNRLLFEAADTVNGVEWWQTDGKRETTGLFKDINPGKNGSYPVINAGNALPVLGNRMVFQASTPEHGAEPWSSDGTPEGTVLLKDLTEGKGSSDPGRFTLSGSTVFFAAMTAGSGQAVWKTDGTPAGTGKLKELGMNQYGIPFRVTDFVSAGKNAFFNVEGIGLWKTDGTEAGTINVKSLYTVADMAAVNDLLYFTVLSGYQGQYQLWKSDGTEAGTVLVKDSLGDRRNAPRVLGESGGKVLFSRVTSDHGRELWVADGTGTALLKDIYPGAAGSLATAVPVAQKDNLLYFTANDGTTGVELWQTDGTAAGTRRVKDILPGAGSSLPANLALLDGQLYFSAFTPEHGVELWKSDGTDAGTVLAADINPGAGHANPARMANLGKDIFFFADTDAHGRQLWHLNPAVTAVEDPLVAAAVAVHPNPTDGAVTLQLAAAQFAGPVTISTLDLTGKVLQSETIRATAGLQPTVNLRSLPPGMYLLRITGAKGTVTKKIIKR